MRGNRMRHHLLIWFSTALILFSCSLVGAGDDIDITVLSKVRSFYFQDSKTKILRGPYDLKKGVHVGSSYTLVKTIESNRGTFFWLQSHKTSKKYGPFLCKDRQKINLDSKTFLIRTDLGLEEGKRLAEKKQREWERREREKLAKQEKRRQKLRQYEVDQRAKGMVKYDGQWMTPQQAQQRKEERAVQRYIATYYPHYHSFYSSSYRASSAAQQLNANQTYQLDAGREAAMGGGTWVGNFRVGRYTYTYDRNLRGYVVYQK